MKHKSKSVSLVLGSGGARGLAHIGVIQVLEEKGYVIKSISGCSIGSVIGGAYAAGKLKELENWMLAIGKSEIVNLLDISWSGSGLFKGDKIINQLRNLLGEVQIQDLQIPFTAVAADIEGQKEVWMNSGSLFDAIRASVSLPLFFTPFNHNGVKLIDGGVLNPVPIAPTFNDNSDLTIAVDLGANVSTKNKPTKPKPSALKGNSFQEGLNDFIKSFEKPEPQSNNDWGMYEVADKAFDTMQASISRQKIAAYPPDILVEISRNACGTLEFDRAAEMISLGRDETNRVLKTWEAQ